VTTERAFIDTNLFLRYLTNDIPEEADRVENLLERAEAGELTLRFEQITVKALGDEPYC